MAAATDSTPAPSRTLLPYRDARGRFAKRPAPATHATPDAPPTAAETAVSPAQSL